MAKIKMRNRLTIYLDDAVYVALETLAEHEGMSIGELTRKVIISDLVRRDLLPEKTVRRLAGVLEY